MGSNLEKHTLPLTHGCAFQARIQEFFKEGVDLEQLFIALLIFSFLMKLYEIIEPRLLEKGV